MPEYPRPQHRIAHYLDTNGDGTGTNNAVGDYSDLGAGATDFYYEATELSEIQRMICCLSDTAGIAAEEYGNLGAALTNGWLLQVKESDDTLLADETGGVSVNTNAAFARNCFDADVKTWGPGNELLVSRWTFEKDAGPIYLREGQKLVVTLNDDFTGLLSHYFFLKGRKLVNEIPELGTENHPY